jgi:hypothetical protein
MVGSSVSVCIDRIRLWDFITSVRDSPIARGSERWQLEPGSFRGRQFARPAGKGGGKEIDRPSGIMFGRPSNETTRTRPSGLNHAE